MAAGGCASGGDPTVDAFDWPVLAAQLTDASSFAALWEHDRYEVARLWVALERNAGLLVGDAYAEVVVQAGIALQAKDEETASAPGADIEFGRGLARLLFDFGHLDAAETLRRRRLEYCEQHAGPSEVQEALGDLAESVSPRSAGRLLRRRLEICRRLVDSRLTEAPAVGLDQSPHHDGLDQPLERDDLDALQHCLCGLAANIWLRRNEPGHDEVNAAAEMRPLLAEARRITLLTGDKAGTARWMGVQADRVWDDEREVVSGLLQRRLRLCREIEELDGVLECLGYTVILRRRDDDLAGALSLMREAEELARDLGRTAALERLLYQKGVILVIKGAVAGAVTALTERVRLLPRLRPGEDHDALPSEWVRRFQRRKQRDQLVRMLAAMRGVARALNDDDALERAFALEGRFFRDMGDTRRALAAFDRQARILRRCGNRRGLVDNLEIRAKLLASSHRRAALALYGQRLAICLELDDEWEASDTLTARAEILISFGKLDGAIQGFREQEERCRHRRPAFVRDALKGQRDILSLQLQKCTDHEADLRLLAEIERVCEELGDYGRAADARRRIARLKRERPGPRGGPSRATPGQLDLSS